jgi:hypothetical protein
MEKDCEASQVPQRAVMPDKKRKKKKIYYCG